jgi:hypothetical protein
MKLTSPQAFFFLLFTLATIQLAAQTNSFPSSGNAGIGGGNSLNFANGLGHPPYVVGTWWDNNNSGIDFHAFANSVDTKALSILPGTGNVAIYNSLYFASGLAHPPYVVGTWWDNNNSGIDFHAFGNSVDLTALSIQPGTGSVGIGTTSPSQLLEVNGNAQVDGGIYFAGDPTHTPQTTPWTGVLCGGDYAEDMRASGSKEKYEPGDVLVLALDDSSDVQKSAEPYSTMVAGIFATKPGLLGRRALVDHSTANIPMAMVGVVPTKVSAENGPIHKGDLLVTSSTAGYAMKGTDRGRLVGAVIGKAMGSLDSGKGVIEALVTLQ